jgi:hypothetical protein
MGEEDVATTDLEGGEQRAQSATTVTGEWRSRRRWNSRGGEHVAPADLEGREEKSAAAEDVEVRWERGGGGRRG